jgi:pimeloyl-ACP methyl ester carboxylesterase
MGGTLAMMIAARRPELAGRIMVVDMLPQPAGLFGGSASSPLANSLRNWISTPGGRRLVGGLLNAFSPPESSNARSDPDVVAQAMHELSSMDLGPQLPRIRAPMTVVYASPDPQGRQAVDRGFAAAYAPARGARLVRIDGAGHMVMLDQPARFQASLRDFLRR